MRDFARHEMLWSLQVPRYFFVIRCPQFLVPDSKGVELSTEADARNYAARLVEELLLDKSYKGMGFEVAVRDDQGEELFVVPFESPHLH
jgi:hypothetical protein